MDEHKLFRVNQYAIIKTPENEALILKGEDVWELPGGRMKEKETPEEGLLREIKEETGITNCKIERIINSHLSKSENTYMVTVLCSANKQQLNLSEEHTDFRWIDKDSLNDLKFDFDKTRELLLECLKT